jgi:hypothetical protein
MAKVTRRRLAVTGALPVAASARARTPWAWAGGGEHQPLAPCTNQIVARRGGSGSEKPVAAQGPLRLYRTRIPGK